MEEMQSGYGPLYLNFLGTSVVNIPSEALVFFAGFTASPHVHRFVQVRPFSAREVLKWTMKRTKGLFVLQLHI